MSGDVIHLDKCKRLIESRYNLDADELTERDFEFLRKSIFEKTRTDISTATLRRIWASQYQRIPQSNTLDALAKFIDFDGWHHFKASSNLPTNGRKLRRGFVQPAILVGLLILVSGIVATNWSESYEVMLEPEVTEYEGVPATIGFNYKVSNSDVEIELSWNPFERSLLDHEGNFYTGTYYYPDYHQVKLIAKDEILTSKNIHVTTPGWHGLVMKSGYDVNPSYLKNDDFVYQDGLSVTNEVLDKYNLKCENQCFVVFTLSNRKLGDIGGDNFSLKATIRSEEEAQGAICQQTDVILKGELGSLRIPISKIGCYGITDLRVGAEIHSGKLNDLSALSTDLGETQEIRLSNSNGRLVVKVGENQEYEVIHKESIGSLKVVKFIFTGPGTVSNFEIKNNLGIALQLSNQ